MKKTEVDYQLDIGLREEIVTVKNAIMTYLKDGEIYLFGSIAKGCYSKTSDIDLLILVPYDMSSRALRHLRHELEEKVEQCCISRQVDIKLYHTNRYRELCQAPCFEQVIQNDLINIMNW